MTTTISRLDPDYPGVITLIEPIVVLDRDMVWADEFKYQLVRSIVTPTIGGGVVVQETAISEIRRPITLSTQDGQGYQTKAIVEALQAQADIKDARFQLLISHNGLSVSKVIRYRNEEDGGAVQFEMCKPMDGLQMGGFWYTGTIYLAVCEW